MSSWPSFVRPATRNKFPRPEGVEVSEYGVMMMLFVQQQFVSRELPVTSPAEQLRHYFWMRLSEVDSGT